MKRVVTVCLGEEARPVGQVHHAMRGAREHAAFEYDPTWLTGADRFSLDPELPLTSGMQFRKAATGGSVFHGAIADSEPDGWAKQLILRDHAKRRVAARQRSGSEVPPVLSALDFLLAVDDFSRIGALRFQDEAGEFCRAAEPGERRAPPLLELRDILAASAAVERDAATANDLAYLRGRGTSLGGMRPKCTVIDDDGHLAIGKFPSVDDTGPITAGEVLALHLARDAGIDAAEARLLTHDDASIALIRRFDRRGSDRVPYLSAATLLQADPGSEHAYTEIADVIRQTGADVTRDLGELWRRMAFSILITNVDDHLRNHGFLHAGNGLWLLAPAFDINPFPGRVRELKTWISEAAGPGATIEALMSVVPHFGLRLEDARHILGAVERAVATWRTVGRTLGLSSGELEYFGEAFEHGEREAAKRQAGM